MPGTGLVLEAGVDLVDGGGRMTVVDVCGLYHVAGVHGGAGASGLARLGAVSDHGEDPRPCDDLGLEETVVLGEVVAGGEGPEGVGDRVATSYACVVKGGRAREEMVSVCRVREAEADHG